MRLIKLGLISFIFLFLLVTGISLFIPSRIRVSRAIRVKAEKDSVMDLLKNPVNWKWWFPGADSAKLYTENGTVTGIITSDGKALVINRVTDSSIVAISRGTGSRSGENVWNILGGSTGRELGIQWYMDFHLRWYPWEKFSSLLFEQSYGSKMEWGLARLKKYLERTD